MTIFASARRKTDGLLTWPQSSPQAPDASAIIQKGVNSFGGVADDWDYAELDNDQYQAVRAALPGRSFLTFSIDPQTEVSTPSLTSKAAPASSVTRAKSKTMASTRRASASMWARRATKAT